MSTSQAGSNVSSWLICLRDFLENDEISDRKKALEFLAVQTDITSTEAAFLFPAIQDNLLHPDLEVRYFARKARANLDNFLGAVQASDFDIKEDAHGKLSETEILLRKLRLGSRYVVFDSMDRLTESRDPVLATPLLEFLHSETDPFKISYLVKRLGRIPDSRVPPAIEAYLRHSDIRVVANAIEGLWELDVPTLKPRFAEFARSPDNRIRANAVRALFKYSPEEAEQHLEDMLDSASLALQDSAIFLLKILHPKNIARLTEMAFNSPFAGIRLRALEIPKAPDSAPVTEKSRERKSIHPHESWGLFLSLIGAGMSVYFFPHSMTFVESLALSGLILVYLAFRSGDTLFMKAALSVVFIGIANDHQHSLITIPVIMIVWLGIGNDSPLLSSSRSSFLACLFSLLVMFLGNVRSSKIAALAETVTGFSAYIGRSKPIVELLLNQKRGMLGAIFFVVVAVTFFLLHVDRVFSRDSEGDRRIRFYVIGLFFGILALAAVQFTHAFGLTALLATNNLADPTQLLRALTE